MGRQGASCVPHIRWICQWRKQWGRGSYSLGGFLGQARGVVCTSNQMACHRFSPLLVTARAKAPRPLSLLRWVPAMSTTTIWKIQVPVGLGFAELNRHYTKPQGEECAKCGSIVDPKHDPLTVEWDDGSNKVGDFVHAGADIVLRKLVAERLRDVATGFDTASIKFFDHPNLHKPISIQDESESRIWLPYDGPPLCQLLVTRKVPLSDRSTVEVANHCDACGAIQYKRIIGVEKKTRAFSKPRISGQGLFVCAADLNGDDVFTPIGTSLKLCTNTVKEFIENEGFTNVELLEYGDLI